MAHNYFERLVAEEQRRETIRQARAARPLEPHTPDRRQLRQALGRTLLRMGAALLPPPDLESLAQRWHGKEQCV